jgi:hypothetical protein
MRYRYAFYPLAAIAFASCDLLSGKCTYETRGLEARGSVSDGSTQPPSATMNLGEQRGSLAGQSLYWLITAADLKGHVLSASFKDGANLSKVLLDLGVAPAGREEISQGATSTQAGANLGGFRDIFVAGRGVIELQTDLPSRPIVQIPLAVTNSTDWFRPNCS